MTAALHIGLLINPLAGVGGSLALKGSDGDEVRALVLEQGEAALGRSEERVKRALAILFAGDAVCQFSTWGGPMGGEALESLGQSAQVLGSSEASLSTSNDTAAAALALRAAGVDVLLFAGGDGTARDIYDALGDDFPVLGIPAGVKMHSGVFAVSPEAAGELLLLLARGQLVGLNAREVRDIDEQAFRRDQVRSRFYGEMLVPGEGRYLQQTKVAGRESQELVAADIAAWLVEEMDPACTYFIGPGSTTAAIMIELGLANTLLGVDAVRDGDLLAADANEQTLLDLAHQASAGVRIVVTAIGGQGHVFGRGNQQFSPAVIRAVGLDHIMIVAAKSKISALQGRPLLVDSNDPTLDRALCGYRPVITGYQDQILYNISC